MAALNIIMEEAWLYCDFCKRWIDERMFPVYRCPVFKTRKCLYCRKKAKRPYRLGRPRRKYTVREFIGLASKHTSLRGMALEMGVSYQAVHAMAKSYKVDIQEIFWRKTRDGTHRRFDKANVLG